MGMAANPPGAHQAGRVFTGRIDRGGVSACYSAARWHAFGNQARRRRLEAASRQDSQMRCYGIPLSGTSIADIRAIGRQVRFVPMNETARAVGRCGMAVPAMDGTMRAS